MRSSKVSRFELAKRNLLWRILEGEMEMPAPRIEEVTPAAAYLTHWGRRADRETLCQACREVIAPEMETSSLSIEFANASFRLRLHRDCALSLVTGVNPSVRVKKGKNRED